MKEFILTGAPQGALKIDYKGELNDQQLDVVMHGDGSALVLAGAGSGKTRTITYRVAWLLEHGVDPSNILLLTFTNRASREMIERVEQLLGTYPQGLWAGTFHSVANRILRRYALAIGFDQNFTILDQDDTRNLVTLCVKELRIDTKNRRFPKASVLHSIISYARNKGATLRDVIESKHIKFLPIFDEIAAVAHRYDAAKREQNAMDFDDLLLHFLTLLQQNERIANELAEQFRYILVDEFQDTNVIQAEIVRRLAARHGNLLVVGDDAQSIYSFRAADIQNILQFPQTYNGTRVFRLTRNYRSTPEILALANASIANNTDQFKKDLEAHVASGAVPEIIPATSAQQEAQFIAEKIFKLHDSGLKLRDIAVLFRAAFHSQALEFELMKRDIPYDYRGGMKFFERSHVKDLVAHIRIFHNVKDVTAWMRVLQIHPGFGLVNAGKVAQKAGEFASLAQAVEGLQAPGRRAQAGMDAVKRILRAMLASQSFPSAMIRALAASDDYATYLEHEFPNFQERLEDLEQFAIFAEQFNDLNAFLEAVSLTDEFGAVSDQEKVRNEDRVILSTVHQAKGLEWSAVFVMHLAEGSFPHSRAFEEEGGMQEERRLFYVATTRARKQLFLTYPTTRGYEHVEICHPSVFLEEIPREVVEEVRLRAPVYRSGGGWNNNNEEPVIVLNDLGERISKPVPKSSFLRSIDEL